MILDTNAVSAFLGGEAAVVKALKAAEELYLPVVVIGEFRYGLAGSRKRKGLGTAFTAFIADCTILPVLETTTLYYARIREGLRKAGTPIPENDIWISALAMEYGRPILTRDRHFDRIPQIKRIQY